MQLNDKMTQLGLKLTGEIKAFYYGWDVSESASDAKEVPVGPQPLCMFYSFNI